MKPANIARSLLFSMLLASGFVAAPASAQVSFNIIVAPPAPIYEPQPVIAPGYVWAPGYWAWNGDRHVWVSGRSFMERPGYRWEPDRWEQRGNAYYRHTGHWEHDASYKPVKVKKEKHSDNRDGDKHKDKGKGGKHGD